MSKPLELVRQWMAQIQVSRLRTSMDSTTRTFPADLMSTKRILVCLPNGLRELTMIKQFLPTLSSLFKSSDITLLTSPGLRVADIFPRRGFNVVTPDVSQLTWAGLPKKTFISQLQKEKFDLILDMNLERSPFTSAVLLQFPEAIRIGRGNHLGEPYYNLEIKSKYLRDERNIYRSLLETLSILMNRPIDNPGVPANN